MPFPFKTVSLEINSDKRYNPGLATKGPETMTPTTKLPVQQDRPVTVSAINVEDMAGYIADLIHESIVKVEEIQRTNPKVDFNLGRDSGNKLVLLASVSFPDDDHTLSPMEYTERLIAAEMIKTLVSNKMKSHQ